MIAMNTNNH